MPDQEHKPKPKASQSRRKSEARGSTRDALDNLEIELGAYIGDAKLTLAELNDLKPDTVLRLDRGLNELVELQLNGVTVATGELVAVGDQFGVRINEIG